MSIRKKYLIHAILFTLIFASLLLIATFYDLQISHILVHNSIPSGKFYSTDVMARINEYIGSFPIFLFGAFACLVLMHKTYNFEGKKKYLAIIFVIAILILMEECIGDTVKYICRNHEVEYIYDSTLTTIIVWVVSALISAVMVYFYRKVDQKKNDELVRFALLVLGVFAFYLLIAIIKGPVGRMRYRAMNLIDDYSYFTPWYVISGAKEEVLSLGLVVPSDGFKSFPSGHTFSAGVSYVLIALPYVYKKFDTKKWRFIWYLIPICYTGFVGLYRIVAGAHFLSDVLIGGTIAYLASEVFKYFLFVRKSNKNLVEE